MYCVREDGLHSEFLDEPLSQGQLLATICLGKARESRHTPCQKPVCYGSADRDFARPQDLVRQSEIVAARIRDEDLR